MLKKTSLINVSILLLLVMLLKTSCGFLYSLYHQWEKNLLFLRALSVVFLWGYANLHLGNKRWFSKVQTSHFHWFYLLIQYDTLFYKQYLNMNCREYFKLQNQLRYSVDNLSLNFFSYLSLRRVYNHARCY